MTYVFTALECILKSGISRLCVTVYLFEELPDYFPKRACKSVFLSATYLGPTFFTFSPMLVITFIKHF